MAQEDASKSATGAANGAKNVAKRWAMDWTAFATFGGVLIGLMQFLNIPFPLVWASDFKVYQVTEQVQWKSVSDNLTALQLSVQTQSLQGVQRELRNLQQEKQKLITAHQSVPSYLDSSIDELVGQDRALNVSISQIRAKLVQ